jgi:hypothetical protein
MVFKLRSQSPLNQVDPGDKEKNMQASLASSNKTVANAKENKKQIGIGEKLSQDWDRQSSTEKAATQFFDPTGISSYPDVKREWSDRKITAGDFTAALGAIPVIGKAGKLFKGAEIVSKGLSATNKVAEGTSDFDKGRKLVGAINKTISKNQKLGKIVEPAKVSKEFADSKMQKLFGKIEEHKDVFNRLKNR